MNLPSKYLLQFISIKIDIMYLKKIANVIFISSILFGCAMNPYKKTIEHLDIHRFMGKWYVISSRPTFLEKNAYNAVEIYTWNEKENRIDIDFSFRKNGFEGELKRIPQKGWIFNQTTKAHWKIQPFWPLKFSYLVIAKDTHYEWAVIGVPDQKYIWLLARTPIVSEDLYQDILQKVENLGYSVKNIEKVPQKW